jgi:cytochrome b subunit of formate dehydrogenase
MTTEKDSNYLQRFNRLLVWFTLVLFILLVLSGYGMTNPEVTTRLTGGIFATAFSMYLHVNLVAPVLILLLIHVLIGMKTALTRWGIEEGWLLDTFLIVLGLFAAALIILMRYLTF